MPDNTPDLSTVVKAVGEVKSAFEEYKKANDDRTKELLKKGDVDPLIEEKMQRIDEELDKKQELIDKLYIATKRKHIQIDGKPVDQEELDAKALTWAQVCAKAQGTRVTEYAYDDLKGYKAAFQRYLRKDDRVLTADEQKALSVGSDPDGGYVVDPDTSGRVVTRMYDTSPMRAFASVQVISTDALEGMHDVDQASSGWVSETGTRSETNTPQLDVWRIPVHEQHASPRATQKLLDDAAVDMEAWLAGKVADIFARTENTAFVAGNGVGKPRGFTTYGDWATAGTPEIGAIEQFDTGVNGGFAADPNGPDVLYNCIYGLKSVYLANATWFLRRSLTGTVRKMQDSNGAYQWQPSVAAGQPALLAGYPVAAFEDMPALGTGSLSMAFGDMAQAYQIVDRMGIRVLRDPYTAKPYVIFYTTKRVGGDVIDFEALKIINFKA